MKKQLKCYIYIRVSASMQVGGYSLDAQKDKLHIAEDEASIGTEENNV